MNRIITYITISYICLFIGVRVNGQHEIPSEFDETTVATIQQARDMPVAFQSAADDFESATDQQIKAAKWQLLVELASESFLSDEWTAPSAGWRLIEYPSTGNLTREDIRYQPRRIASYTKLVAQNETEVVKLRGAGALLATAASDGEEWGSILLLNIAGGNENNIKRLAYWFTIDFAIDKEAIDWSVDWIQWHQVYNNSDTWGRAIILRNILLLAHRVNNFDIASAISLSALNGSNRDLKAIALAFGDPVYGEAVHARWEQLANDSSDPQIQALAQEAMSTIDDTTLGD